MGCFAVEQQGSLTVVPHNKCGVQMSQIYRCAEHLPYCYISHLLLASYPQRGVELVDGPVHIEDSVFERFVQTGPWPRSDAISFYPANSGQMTPANYVNRLEFDGQVQFSCSRIDMISVPGIPCMTANISQPSGFYAEAN